MARAGLLDCRTVRVLSIVVLLTALLTVSGCASTLSGDDRQAAEPLKRPVVLVLSDGPYLGRRPIKNRRSRTRSGPGPQRTSRPLRVPRPATRG